MEKIIGSNKLLKTDKSIFYISVITSSFLMMIYINHIYIKLSFVLIGVFQEMLTIPCLLSQPVILYVALKRLFRVKFKINVYTFFAITISLITMILTWGSWLLAWIN